MTQISSPVFFEKYLFLPLVIIFLMWMELKSSALNINNETISLFQTFFYVIAIVAFYIYIRRSWPIMDKVLDSGDSLTFRRHGKEIEIKYSQINQFNIRKYSKEADPRDEYHSYYVEVNLKINTALGECLKFKPAMKGNFYGKPIERIYEIAKIIHDSNS